MLVFLQVRNNALCGFPVAAVSHTMELFLDQTDQGAGGRPERHPTAECDHHSSCGRNLKQRPRCSRPTKERLRESPTGG